ncbi:DUF7563 family protein [Haloterrigena salifodinae]
MLGYIRIRSHVTERYKRVFLDNQGVLHACSNQMEMFEGSGADE